jgi:predicted nucleotidyltransferase
MLDRLQGVFKSLNDREVDYLVIGGIAAILHGVPRATFDLDILIRATPENARRLLAAFLDAGLGTATLTTPEAILGNEISIFRDRVRVDVQTSTPGIDFDTAHARRVDLDFRGVTVPVLSREDLIASKRAAGRPIDLEDARLLSEVRDDSS